jgi:predicted nucleic acid-binding Zn ribbon protein
MGGRERSERQGASRPAGPQAIGRIVSRLLARTGYDREQGAEAVAAAWREAVPAGLAAHARAGRVRRGVLEVFVSHSAVIQEFSFQKQALLARLQASLPAAGITDIRCRLADGPIDP